MPDDLTVENAHRRIGELAGDFETLKTERLEPLEARTTEVEETAAAAKARADEAFNLADETKNRLDRIYEFVKNKLEPWFTAQTENGPSTPATAATQGPNPWDDRPQRSESNMTQRILMAIGALAIIVFVAVPMVNYWWPDHRVPTQPTTNTTRLIEDLPQLRPSGGPVASTGQNGGGGARTFTIEHPFADVSMEQQWRCKIVNGQRVRTARNDPSATGWCHD